METLSIIQQFSLTKTQIDVLARRVLEEIDGGNHNPLNIFLCLKAMEELVKRLKDGIADQVLAEAEKYGKQFDYLGSRVQLSERRTYDFSCDSTWCELDKTKKQREEMLRHITQPVADPDTGEMIYPAQFKITPVITITLPR
ncbi:MAG: hypothetical protein PHD61_06440 [Bacteroidales bacterium]|nr:hypothetical protein [Lentimicrobiaceae bacterium]MDD5694927.1 hypothetical protein [Bacteroidales bacterium]